MFKNKNANGRRNICGGNIALLRKSLNISQRALADRLQLLGLDVSKNAVQQIECGLRFVTDIELKIFAKVFRVTADALLEERDGG